jgi:hypothetical protein
VTLSQLLTIVAGAIEGLGAVTVFLLALFIGVCVLLTLVKFRPTRNTRTIKSLDELVGDPIRYLPPTTPRGQMDQLGAVRRSAGSGA